MEATEFLHDLRWSDLPEPVRVQAGLNLLDLVGVGIGGATTCASAVVRDFAQDQMSGVVPMMFDTRTASPPGAAFAAAATIDALDGHDGFNLAKGHAGCATLAACWAFSEGDGGDEFLTRLVLGYELGSRLAMAQHGSVPDYHTSGSWMAVACAGIGARALGLDRAATRHALGIGEYHGPRSQMMRGVDHPTMVKDGSGWGAMAGVSAALLAQAGFTGAPALTVEKVTEPWADLGQRWLVLEQYYKPFPVCRWAQPPIEAALVLRAEHGLAASDVDRIEIETFHESVRLATSEPRTTDEAQYSTSFPVAVALARGGIGAADLADEALADPEILRLSRATVMRESDRANAAFPARRQARVRLHLRDGRVVESGWTEPRWDATAPPTADELRAKFRGLAEPVIGTKRAQAIEAAVDALPWGGIETLRGLLAQPISRATSASSRSK